MRSPQARASSSPVILVGTHLDVSDEKQRKACIGKITKELLNKRGFPAIRDYHFVNATEESDALAKLRKTIVNESLNFKVEGVPPCGLVCESGPSVPVQLREVRVPWTRVCSARGLVPHSAHGLVPRSALFSPICLTPILVRVAPACVSLSLSFWR